MKTTKIYIVIFSLCIPAFATSGCRSPSAPKRAIKSSKANAAQQSSSYNTMPDINDTKAIEIVKAAIADSGGDDAIYDCNVTKHEDGFRVFVLFGSGRDREGKLTGTPIGGHILYDISLKGDIVRVIKGR